MAKILVVEDDRKVADTIERWLTHEKHVIEVIDDGSAASHYMRINSYDAIILDWQLPGKSGIEICKEFRRQGGKTPVLMLTGKSTVDDKGEGFEAGADDYLTKPFDVRELGFRLKAIMRRGPEVFEEQLIFGPLVLDTKLRKLTIEAQNVTLLPKEFAILELLMKHPGEIFSAEAMLNRVWSSESDSTEHTVRTYMHTLRKKLSAQSCDVLKTVHGVGYRLELPLADRVGQGHD
ncbi:MAG TPA: response regulator transcription factor [Chroococcales cyanobacterium]